MATDLTKAFSTDETLLLWHAIEAHDGYELHNILTNKFPAETDRPRRSNRAELVRRLVESGADVNAVRADGFTPLLLAVFFGHRDVVQVLVEHGADVNACTRFETTAEMWAQARGFTDIVEYLHNYQEKPLPLPNTTVENDEWFKESLVSEPVIEEPSTFERFATASDETEPPIEEPSTFETYATPRNDETEPPIEEPSTFETYAAPTFATASDDYSERTIPSALLESIDDDDERTLVRPVTEERVSAKVLKDPPEIWDLVHENRNSFNARAAFLSHVGSFRARIALLTFLFVATAAAIGFAAIRLQGGGSAPTIRSVESRKSDSAVQPAKVNQPSATSSREQPQPQAAEEKPIINPSNTSESQPSTDVSTTQAVSDSHQIRSAKQNRRTTPLAPAPSSVNEISNNTPAESAPTKTETKTLPTVQGVTVAATVNAEVTEATTKKTPNSNSKLIQNSSAPQPRKPRVIQWP